MSDLKFSCPSCGQHIQCDEDHAGENIPCPDCAHLIRVPATAPIVAKPAAPTAETSFPTPEESKVSYTSTEEEKQTVGKAVPTLEENFAASPGKPASPGNPPVTDREAQLAAARAAHSAQASTAVKPRLSFILSGGAAPADEENKSAAGPEQVPDAANQPHREIETVNE